jgi:hypothetical protein
MITHTSRWSHPPDNTAVPSRWQATESYLRRREHRSRSCRGAIQPVL